MVTLPRSNYCYILIPTKNNSLGIVKWGETGYYETNFPEGYNQDVVDKLNLNLGLTLQEAEAMHICSMIKKLNTVSKWESHYRMILDAMKKHPEREA